MARARRYQQRKSSIINTGTSRKSPYTNNTNSVLKSSSRQTPWICSAEQLVEGKSAIITFTVRLTSNKVALDEHDFNWLSFNIHVCYCPKRYN